MRHLLATVLIFGSLIMPNAHAAEGDTMNFRFSPLSLLLTTFDAHVDFALSPEWTLGPQVIFGSYTLSSSGSFSEYKVSNAGLGLRANWMMNGVFTDGLYVSPGLIFQRIKVTAKDSVGDVTASASVPQASGIVGYAWFWDSFNIQLGGGLAFPLGSPDIKVKDSTGYEQTVKLNRLAGLALEFTLGWTY